MSGKTVSVALPEEADLAQTATLVEELESCGIFEDHQELEHRQTVLEKLELLFKEWLTEVCEQMDVPEAVKAKVEGRIVPFGSFHLGAHTKGGDIDALCIGPEFVERTKFFSSFYKKLKSQKEAGGLKALEEAHVPVIKLNFDGIEVDLVYARVMQKSIHDELNLLDDRLLQGMDAASVRSLNGYKVTEEILRNVHDVHNFQLALRAIKLWAKRRNIYSCKLGFLGGVSWAILMARTCQLYPNASAATLVLKFFMVFNIWESPDPVMLKRVINPGLNMPEWDPKVNQSDLMPILTPVYPQQNSSFSISRSTLTVIKEEMKRGLGVSEAILQGKDKWTTLFERSQFKDQYKHYFRLNLTSAPVNHSEWAGLLEWKIRNLVGTIEKNQLISLAHVNMEPHIQSRTDGLKTTLWLIGLVFNMDVYKHTMVNLNNEFRSFKAYVHSLAESLKMSKSKVTISGKYIVREDGRWIVPDEYNRVFRSPNPNIQRKAEAPAKSHQDGQGFAWKTISPSGGPSLAQQKLKRPLSPQLASSSKRFRGEDARLKRFLSPQPGSSKKGFRGEDARLKRPLFPQPASSSKRFRSEDTRLKRPPSPQPASSSKRFRGEDARLKRFLSPQPGSSKEGFRGEDARLKRPLFPQHGSSKKGFRGEDARLKRPPSPQPGSSKKGFRGEDARLKRPPSPQPGSSGKRFRGEDARLKRPLFPQPGSSKKGFRGEDARLKRPLSPQPGSSGNRFRGDDITSRPSPFVKQSKERNSAPQREKRACTPEPEPVQPESTDL